MPSQTTAPHAPLEPLQTFFPACDRWLDERRVMILLLIVLAAGLFRVAYFSQISASPLIHMHRITDTDMHFFDAWAKQLNRTGWLQTSPAHPFPGWKQVVFDAYAKKYPQRVTAFAAAHPETSADHLARKQWQIWLGGNAYYQEPLYAYLIALTYRIFGDNPQWVFAWQMLLGVLTVLFAHLTMRRFFGALVALVVALGMIAYAPLIFYEAVLMRTTLILFLSTLTVFCSQRMTIHPTPQRIILAGIIIALGILAKSTFVLFLVGGVIILAINTTPAALSRSRMVTIFLLAALLTLAPVMARNVSVGVSPLRFSGSALTSVSLLNTVDSPQRGWAVSTTYMPTILAAADGDATRAFRAALATHPDYKSIGKMFLRKGLYAWWWFEQPNNVNLYSYSLHASILKKLPLSFLAVGPLGLVGMFFSWRYWRQTWPLYVLFASGFMSILSVSFMARYRLPMALALILFAGVAVVQMAKWIHLRQWGRSLGMVAIILLLTFLMNRPLPENETRQRPADMAMTYELQKWMLNADQYPAAKNNE